VPIQDASIEDVCVIPRDRCGEVLGLRSGRPKKNVKMNRKSANVVILGYLSVEIGANASCPG